MRPFLFSAALVLVASSNVHATEALLFNGGGYSIEVLIGFLDDPVIAQIHFTSPGAKNWVSLPRDLLRIEKFDMKKSILIMHFSNKNNPDLPASFSLSANNTRGILSLAATGVFVDEMTIEATESLNERDHERLDRTRYGGCVNPALKTIIGHGANKT